MTDYKGLIEKAVSARMHSYSPYSRYKVGAALLCADGTVYLGTNVENASYGETVCAERVAVLKAVSEGKREFEAIAIVGGKDEICGYAFPCGACRQVLSEFCDPKFEIVLFDGKTVEIRTLGQVFPSAFGKDALQK